MRLINYYIVYFNPRLFLVCFLYQFVFQRALVYEYHAQSHIAASGTSRISTLPPALVAELLESDDEDDHLIVTSVPVPAAALIKGEDDESDFLKGNLEQVKKMSLQIQEMLRAQEKANNPHTHLKNYLGMLKHWHIILSTDLNFTANPSLNPLPNTPRVQPNSNFAKQPTFKSIKKKKVAKNRGPKMLNALKTQVYKYQFLT
jgi:hypothetical protein